MTRVVEVSGAQLLPDVRDPGAVLTAWGAHLACDADLRTVAPFWRGIANNLRVET